ncbi:MAG TPA: hypothetical protein VGB18_01975 [Candidatus Thermoplasmatota archaeon]
MRKPLSGLAVLLLTFAGCILPGNDRFPRHDESKTQEYPNFENLVLRGRLQGEGPQVTLTATATNEGPYTYKISSICVPPWSDSLVSSLGEVHRTEPMGYCAAFGLKEFKPGQTEKFEATWNGTLWDSHKEAYVDAAAGKYVWHLLFHAYSGGKSDGEYEGHDTIRLEFTANVK